MKSSVLVLLIAGSAFAQTSIGDKVTVPFSDPNRPRMLKVNLMHGSMVIKGYDGKDAIIEARGDAERRRRRAERPDGLRRLDMVATGLVVEEENNVITVGNRAHSEAQITIQVPVNTSLYLRLTNGGDIVAENISGEIDANCTNGGVKLTNISGNVVAHALNDDVTVTFNKVTPNKAMSFSSLNGDIDVTLPADTKARLKMKSNQGEIFSDFDIQLDGSSRSPQVEDNRGRGGKFRVEFDRGFTGAINGGGPEIQLTTFNGKILLRKSK